MRLQAGLIRTSPLWGSILDQEGFPWQTIRSPDQVDVEHYSVLIAGKITGSRWEEVVKGYVRNGGAALIEQDLMARWWDGKKRWETYRYLIPDGSFPFRGNRLIDLTGRGLVLERAGKLRSDRGGEFLPIILYGEGFVSSFPFDLPRLVSDGRSSRKLFPSPFKPYPSERVSRVPKGELRQLVRILLRALHHLRGHHYAHVWYFPGEASNLFGLRIDTDYSSRDEVGSLYRLLDEKKVAASWYLHVKAHVGWIRDFAEMGSQEIGVHCYAHREYGSSGLGAPDIAKATDLLRAAGLEPTGFAAPYGIWSENLPIDLGSIGFRYSSEFGFDYDNLPSYPWVRGGFSNILQLPVHPISIGSMERIDYRDREMSAYYDTVVDWKLSVDEPVFIYVHPGDGHVGVLRDLLERIDEEGIRRATLGEFAGDWRERRAFLDDLELTIDAEGIRCRHGGNDRSDRFRIAILDRMGRRSFTSAAHRIEWNDLNWEDEPGPTDFTGDVRALLGDRRRRVLEDIRTYFWRRRG